MTYANGRVIHDADSHVMETREWLEPFIDAEFVGKLQPVLGEQPGRLDKLVEQAKQRRSDPVADAAAAEHPIAGPKGWIAYGGFDPLERKKVMDNFGFASQLVFPTAGLGPMRAARDEATKYAAARAYNRAIAAFCAEDRRLIPVAYTPLDNVELALASACEALANGCGAVMFSNGAPGDKSPGHPDFDPFWQLLCERDVPFLLHIGQGTLTQPQPFRNNGRERAPDLHGGGENLRFCDYPMLWVAPQIFLTAMVYDGVFMRFPKLRGGVDRERSRLGAGFSAFARHRSAFLRSHRSVLASARSQAVGVPATCGQVHAVPVGRRGPDDSRCWPGAVHVLQRLPAPRRHDRPARPLRTLAAGLGRGGERPVLPCEL